MWAHFLCSGNPEVARGPPVLKNLGPTSVGFFFPTVPPLLTAQRHFYLGGLFLPHTGSNVVQQVELINFKTCAIHIVDILWRKL